MAFDEQIEAEWKRLEEEGNTQTSASFPKLGYLNRLVDQQYLLDKMRLYVRVKCYKKFLKKNEADLNESEFHFLIDLIKSKKEIISLQPDLFTYKKLIDVLERPLDSEGDLDYIEDV